MSRSHSFSFLLAALMMSCLAPTLQAGEAAADAKRIREAMDRAVRWLASQQNPDGGYGPYGEKEGLRLKNTSDAGITAYVLYAIARHPQGYKASDGAFVARAVDFLLARQQPDGGFYDTKDPTLQNYKTSVAVMALSGLDRVKYAKEIQQAQAFIKAQQFTEAGGHSSEKSADFGGVGYGGKPVPDLSNSQYAADALRESGLSGSDELWARLAVFVSRCQNSDVEDPLLRDLKIGSTKDGGFRYAPTQTRGPEETLDTGARVFSSYGSMTYAGLKTLLYASVKKEDPRVQQAFAWISRNFTVKENPGMATKANPKAGLHGLFYYYNTMAKTLSVYGEPVLRDGKGVEHRWAKELGDHLLAIQNQDGYWQNTSDRWYENIEALDTAYAVSALSICRAELEKDGAKAAGPPTGETKAK